MDVLLDEAIDLELTLALVPHCEVRHEIFVSPDGSHPECSLIATHQISVACQRRSSLACHELADWLSDTVFCAACGRFDCIRVRGL